MHYSDSHYTVIGKGSETEIQKVSSAFHVPPLLNACLEEPSIHFTLLYNMCVCVRVCTV